MITQKLHSSPCLASSTALLQGGVFLCKSNTYNFKAGQQQGLRLPFCLQYIFTLFINRRIRHKN